MSLRLLLLFPRHQAAVAVTRSVLQGELPPELQEVQEEAKQEKKSQGGYRCAWAGRVREVTHIQAIISSCIIGGCEHSLAALAVASNACTTPALRYITTAPPVLHKHAGVKSSVPFLPAECAPPQTV